MGEAVAGSVSWVRWAACWTMTAGTVVAVAAVTGRPVAGAAVAVLAAAAGVEAALAYLTRRFGGITGDILGALVAVAECALLLVGSC